MASAAAALRLLFAKSQLAQTAISLRFNFASRRFDRDLVKRSAHFEAVA